MTRAELFARLDAGECFVELEAEIVADESLTDQEADDLLDALDDYGACGGGGI